jgi:adenylate cyclase
VNPGGGVLRPLMLRRILKGDAGRVVDDLLGALGNTVSILSADGEVILGRGFGQAAERIPVILKDEVLGWVAGDGALDSVAALLRLLAGREQEKRELARETLEKYREIHLLYRMSELVAEKLDLAGVAGLVIEEARRTIPATGASVMLADPVTGVLEVAAGFGGEHPAKTVLGPGEGVAGSVMASGRAELLNNARVDPRFKPGSFEVHALMCAPLRCKDKTRGVINMSHKAGVEYTAADLQLLSALAAQAASAIENVILHERRVQQERIRGNLERYVPSQVVDLILKDRNEVSLASERRHIAVLFSDIRDFTFTCEALSPEEVVSHLNTYFTEMVEEIFENEGTVNKFVGDMIVALFGAPVRLENPEASAVRTAVSMQERIRGIREPWIHEHFHTGIGVSAGRVVVGNIGSPRHMDYTAIGDEVNVAARLQSRARGGQVLVSRNVYERARNGFHFRPMGPIQVKGRQQPVDTYEVVC